MDLMDDSFVNFSTNCFFSFCHFLPFFKVERLKTYGTLKIHKKWQQFDKKMKKLTDEFYILSIMDVGEFSQRLISKKGVLRGVDYGRPCWSPFYTMG